MTDDQQTQITIAPEEEAPGTLDTKRKGPTPRPGLAKFLIFLSLLAGAFNTIYLSFEVYIFDPVLLIIAAVATLLAIGSIYLARGSSRKTRAVGCVALGIAFVPFLRIIVLPPYFIIVTLITFG